MWFARFVDWLLVKRLHDKYKKFCGRSKQRTSSEDTLAVKAKYRRKRPSVIRDTDEQVAPALMKVRRGYLSISTCSEQYILPRAQSCLYK